MTQTDELGNFVFSKVPRLPYGVEIERPNFCWVKKLQRVTVQKESVKNIVFQQKGYEMNFESNRAITAKMYNV
jgi:hypothetical protein